LVVNGGPLPAKLRQIAGQILANCRSLPGAYRRVTRRVSQSEPLAFFNYAAGNKPTTIAVVWPDGSHSPHPFQAGLPRITLQRGP